MTARPGMVIGRSGTGIEDLKSELEKMTGKTIIIDIKEVRRTELDAQLMQKEAKEMADKISEESEAMKARFIDFRTRYKKLLQSELQRFESLSGEMFPELGVDDFDDLPEMTPLQNLEQKPGAKAAPKPAPKPERGTYDYGKRHYIRIYGPGCRLSGYSSNAAVRLSRYHGRYPLLATTQPNFRCDKEDSLP